MAFGPENREILPLYLPWIWPPQIRIFHHQDPVTIAWRAKLVFSLSAVLSGLQGLARLGIKPRGLQCVTRKLGKLNDH